MPDEQKTERKLSAILSADVKGYSRLMSDDEAHTIKILKEYQILITKIVNEHSGRVVNTPGDNILAEFSSIINAVKCSVDIQKKLKARNAGLPLNKRLEFRIGVNIGDVIQDGDHLYGEGVNIAARIEGLADPGGVCISRNAYDHIRNNLRFGYEFLGDHFLKNIKQPIGVYKVLMGEEDAGKLIGEKPKSKSAKWIFSIVIIAFIALALIGYQLYHRFYVPEFDPASIEKMALPLPDKPSIAVLAFDNLTKDPSQEYFSDGISEQIITTLSNVPHLFVIARNSTFAYKNKSVKVQQIAHELGVRYVLEGSVQKSEDRLRITAQLIDAISGHHLWAENYDRKITDIFRIQDEITMEIVSKLQIELSVTELGRLSAIKTDNLRAYEKYLKGNKHLSNRTIGDTLKAREFAQEAIELDPSYGAAYQLLARTYIDEIFMHQVESRDENLQKAENLVQESVRFSGEDYMTHRTLSALYFLKKDFEKAIEEAEKAVELSPNSAECQYMLGMILGLEGAHEKALPILERAVRLNPVTPVNYLNHLARQYFFLHQYKKAIALWEKTLRENPDYYYAHVSLAAAYQLIGEKEKARESLAELIRIKPNFTLSFLEKRFIQKGENDKKLFLKALREAGLPE